MMYTWKRNIIPLISATVCHIKKLLALAGIAMLVGTSVATAAEIDITTEFMADLSHPQNNSFVNTTIPSGFCGEHPEYCQPGSGYFTIMIPGLGIGKYYDYLSPDIPKNHLALSVDSSPRAIKFIELRTGHSFTGTFRLNLVGMTHRRDNAESGDISDALKGAGYGSSSGECSKIGTAAGSSNVYIFAWILPSSKSLCSFELNEDSKYQGKVNISEISFGYELTTTSPLEIRSGDYIAEVIYTVGTGGDIDFYSDDITDNEIRLNVKATVKQDLMFKWPAGNEHVSLEPKGGWSQWVNGGRVPDSLSKTVPFTLSSSSGFTVRMACDYNLDGGCALQETISGTGDRLPLVVSLSLPGYKAVEGGDVNDMLLTTSLKGHAILPPGHIAIERRSQVDFKVQKPGVERMVKSPGSTWKGGVTLIFDTQMD